MLGDIRKKYNIQVTTDIHESYQASAAGEVCDILQIPAFLCRQTEDVYKRQQSNILSGFEVIMLQR